MKKLLLFLTLLIFTQAVQATPQYSALCELSDAFSQIAKRATPAVVFIVIEGRQPSSKGEGDLFDFFCDPRLRRFFDLPPLDETGDHDAPTILSQGSGFLVSPDGYIVTNNHIVREANRLEVHLDDGREFEAKVVGTDPKTDIAVIKIEACDLPYLVLGSSSDLQTGQFVVAIGSPFGLGGTLTHGIISATNRDNLRITDFEDFIQTDAAINPGNSGGPLLNLKGEVIGVNTALISGPGVGLNVGIGLAIPSDMARHVMEQLVSKGAVTRGYLGIAMQPLTRDLTDAFGLNEIKGIIVTDVQEGSPAEEAGLEPDDVIVEYNDRPIETLAEFRNRIAMMRPNDLLCLGVMREGRRLDLTVLLGIHPENIETAADIAKKIGIEVIHLTESLRRELGYATARGVVVSAVRAGSPAALVGIRPGMLIQRVDKWDVSTPAEFANRLELNSQQNKPIVFKIRASNRTHFVTIKLR